MKLDFKNEYQSKQDDLNKYILRERGIVIVEDIDPKIMTKNEYLKNMILACYDEIREVFERPLDASEYIDTLHFVLSIANILDIDLDIPKETSTVPLEKLPVRLQLDMLLVARNSRIFKHWSVAQVSDDDWFIVIGALNRMVLYIYTACDLLGTSMEQEYSKKYQINVERQKNNY